MWRYLKRNHNQQMQRETLLEKLCSSTNLNKPSHKSIVVAAVHFTAMEDVTLEDMPTK